MKRILIKFEYQCFPLWIYENDTFIDNIFPENSDAYNELEKKLGYEPDFHDDHVEKVTITGDRVEFDLKTESKILYKLIFEDVKEINLKGEMWGIVGIIFGLEKFKYQVEIEI